MFVAGRVLFSYGIGVLAMQYYPNAVAWSGVPTLVIGFVLLGLAAKGLLRKSPDSN